MSNGRIGDFDLFLSNDPNNFGAPVVSGTLQDVGSLQTVTLPPTPRGRYLKVVVKSDQSSQGLAKLAELSVMPAS